MARTKSTEPGRVVDALSRLPPSAPFHPPCPTEQLSTSNLLARFRAPRVPQWVGAGGRLRLGGHARGDAGGARPSSERRQQQLQEEIAPDVQDRHAPVDGSGDVAAPGGRFGSLHGG